MKAEVNRHFSVGVDQARIIALHMWVMSLQTLTFQAFVKAKVVPLAMPFFHPLGDLIIVMTQDNRVKAETVAHVTIPIRIPNIRAFSLGEDESIVVTLLSVIKIDTMWNHILGFIPLSV